MRIGGEVPGRRVHSAQRLESHVSARRTATSDRYRWPAIKAWTSPELCSGQAIHAAGRKTTPSGASPVITKRHSAMSNFLASATIMVLRVLPRASAVRVRYH